MSQLRVVLLGIIGHGRTYLFNKITLANEHCAANGQFEIVDTPGFEAGEDKLLHAAGVIAALAQGEVNRILVVVKFERTYIMINKLKRIIEPLQRYKDLITISVSHWDYLQQDIIKSYKSQESQQKQEIQAKQEIELAIQQKYNICSVIFTSLNDQPQIITKKITEIILNSRFAKIQLQKSEIFSQFDLLSLDDGYQTELDNFIWKFKNSFRKIANLS